jgi:conjugal transfer pilus assembly protein TraK
MKPLFQLAYAIIFAALSAASTASAQTVLDITDAKPRHAPIAKANPTRISIENGRITQVVFDETELRVSEDKVNGQVFVVPVSADRSSPISMFVLTEGATHTLILEPRDLPVATVTIREAARPGQDGRAVAKTPIERAGALDLGVKRLISVMARGESSPEFKAVDLREPRALWAEASLLLVRRFEGRQLVGEHYVLRNVSGSVMRLAEQELFIPGVIGVSIELHQLAPGASTNVFVVRMTNG